MEQQDREKTVEFDPSRFFESFVGVGKELIFRPRNFFRQLPHKGELKNPFTFLIICAFLSSLFMTNLRKGDYNLFFVLFFANTMSAFIGSFILHGLISRIFSSNAPFEATFRIIAYASLMDLASWIPVLGPVAYFYGLYLIFLGLQEIHQLKPRQAGAAVISIILIIMLLLLCIILVAPEGLNEGIKFMDPENAGF
jgi:hypothetical protein